MSEGWQIVIGLAFPVAGVVCLSVFLSLTFIAMYRGWDTHNDVFRDQRSSSWQLETAHARWRRPAWRLGWWMRERKEDRDEWRQHLRGLQGRG